MFCLQVCVHHLPAWYTQNARRMLWCWTAVAHGCEPPYASWELKSACVLSPAQETILVFMNDRFDTIRLLLFKEMCKILHLIYFVLAFWKLHYFKYKCEFYFDPSAIIYAILSYHVVYLIILLAVNIILHYYRHKIMQSISIQLWNA